MKQILTIMKRLILFLTLAFVTMGCPGQGISELEWLRNQQAVERSTILNGLVVSYQFEENTTTLEDDLGVHDGTHTNGPAFTTSGANGNAFAYDGANDYTEVTWHNDFQLTGPSTVGLTLMCDMYPTAAGESGTSHVVGLFHLQTGNHVYNIGYNSSNNIRLRVTGDSGISTSWVTTADAPLNSWTRVIMRWEDGDNIYIDTDRSDDAASPSTYSTVSGALDESSPANMPFMIGGMDTTWSGWGTREFIGRVDNVMLWDRKLTEAEVTKLLNGNPTYNELAN